MLTTEDAAGGEKVSVNAPPTHGLLRATRAPRATRAAWALLLAAVVYGVVGVTFAVPAHGSAFQVRAWRLAAWVVSGVVFAAHIGYAHWRLRTSPVTTALHASVGAALGALLLAAAAAARAYQASAGNLPAFRLALVVWPVVTVVPAFSVALAIAALLTIQRRREDPRASDMAATD